MATATLDVNIDKRFEGDAAETRQRVLARGLSMRELSYYEDVDPKRRSTELELTIGALEHSPLGCERPESLLQLVEEGLMKVTGHDQGATKLSKAADTWGKCAAPERWVLPLDPRWDAATSTLRVSAFLPTELVAELGDGVAFEAYLAFGTEASDEREPPRSRPDLVFDVVADAEPIELGAQPESVLAVGDEVYFIGRFGEEGLWVSKAGAPPVRVLSKKDAKGVVAVAGFEGKLYVGGGAGVRVLEDGKTVATLKKEQGLANNKVTSFAVADGALLIGTATGYSVLGAGGALSSVTEGLADKKVKRVHGEGGVVWLVHETAITRRASSGVTTAFKKTQGVHGYCAGSAMLEGGRLVVFAGDDLLLGPSSERAEPTKLFSGLPFADSKRAFCVGGARGLHASSDSLLLRYDGDRPVQGWNFPQGVVECVTSSGDVYLVGGRVPNRRAFRVTAARLGRDAG